MADQEINSSNVSKKRRNLSEFRKTFFLIAPKNEKQRREFQVEVGTVLKGIVHPFEFGDGTRLIRSGIKKQEARQVFFNFITVQSHERSLQLFTAA